MGTILLVLFQLWNQPSVRMLGFGEYFAGYIPDPITDLTFNPAYLKLFGLVSSTYDGLQIYSKLRTFRNDSLDETSCSYEFYENDELLSFYAMYPKWGIAWRVGAWQRFDARDYMVEDFEFIDYLAPQLWLYGQEGFLISYAIHKYVSVGFEYNFSWNNQPDYYYYYTKNNLYQVELAQIYHDAWSNEIGGGFIIHNNNNFELSFAIRKNTETDEYLMDTTGYYWRENEPTEYESEYEFMQLNTYVRHKLDRINLTYKFMLFRKDTEAWYPDFRTFNDTYNIVLLPGVGITFQAIHDLTVSAAISYREKHNPYEAYEKMFIFAAGFEKKFGTLFAARFGNMAGLEATHNYAVWNQINMGFELQPYDKLQLHVATQNLTNFSYWTFGLSFAL